MSTEPSPRPSRPARTLREDLPRVRRSLPRRIARIVGVTISSVIALVALLLVFLQTPWGKSLVRGRIEAKLAAMVNGEVSLGSVDYTFLFHEIELGELQIRDAQGKPAIGLASLHVALDRGSLLAGAPVIEELAIAGLDVAIVKSADGRSNLTGLFKSSKRKPLASIRVDKIAVAGAATFSKADGTVIAVRDLHLAGTLSARPVAKELDLALRDLGANATITTISMEGATTRELTVGIASVALGRRHDAVDLDIKQIAVGALGIETVGAHLKLAGNRLAGTQAITLAGLRVDDDRLAKLFGRELLLDDATLDVSITGPVEALVVDGEVKTGGSKLALDGTVDLSKLERPRYQLALAGTGLRSDVVVSSDKTRPLVESSLHVNLIGAGAAPGDIDAQLGVAIGPTKIGKLAVNGLTVAATARQGAFSLDLLRASAPGVSIDARGAVATNKTVTGRVNVRGTPAEVEVALAEAGIVLPRRVPLPPHLDLAINATGNLDGTVAVELEPARVRVAGGEVSLAGHARLLERKLEHATTTVGLHRLDLASIARLAGKRPKVTGKVSGTLSVDATATSRRATYDLALALDKLGLAVNAKGTADETGATAKLTAMRARDRAVIATIDASIPLTKRGDKRIVNTAGKLVLDIDVARRSLADFAELLPARLRGKLPAGDAELHVDITGTAARPVGTIELAVTAQKIKQQQQRVTLHADLTSSERGLAFATSGKVWLRDEPSPIATLGGTVTTALPLVGGKLDAKALRASAVVDAVIDVPEREIASLAFLEDKLASVVARVDGRITVKGALETPALVAKLAVHGFATAAGTPGRVTLHAEGTPSALTAKITHGDTVAITAAIDRSVKDRISVDVAALAKAAPLLPLLPASLAPKLGKHQVGSLDWDMQGKVALVRGAHGFVVEKSAVTGTLDLEGGAFMVPNSTRQWRDIELAIASEPTGIRIKSLALHEHDRQVADRKLQVSGFVALDQFKPSKVNLSLAAQDWLLSGSTALGMHDAPRGTATFDLGVVVDLTAPVLAVDATVNSLAVLIPDRLDRGHMPELISVGGDVIYLDAKAARAGKLPVAVRPATPAAPKPRRPMDIRVHIPKAIHVEKAPLDIMARGELAVTVRTEGVTTRGELTVESGTVSIMGRTYNLVGGSVQFSEAAPKGNLALTFERPLPPAVMRQLSIASGGKGARFGLSGVPSAPALEFGGAGAEGLTTAMALNGTGNNVFVSAPDLPASATVVAPRGDTFGVISFMASNLPHLLVLDRVNAYADPYRGTASYGRIENAEVERYSVDQKARIRGVVRPLTPGRSSAEVQVDRLLINDNRTAVGVGMRAGDRVGGGVGLFVEWSSDD